MGPEYSNKCPFKERQRKICDRQKTRRCPQEYAFSSTGSKQGHVKTEAGTGVMQPPAKKCLQPSEAGSGKEGFSEPSEGAESITLLIPSF